MKQDFTNAYFDQKIDSIKNKIQGSVYADPKKFYPNTKFDSSFNYDLTLSGPGGLTIFGLKSFIAERSVAINTSFANNTVICWPVGIPETQVPDFHVELFPNPVVNECSIQSSLPMYKLNLLDMTGRLILSRQLKGDHYTTLSIGQLSHGVYMIEVNGGESYRIVK